MSPGSLSLSAIAWGLSAIPRFAGQSMGPAPYSVAEHSVAVLRAIDNENFGLHLLLSEPDISQDAYTEKIRVAQRWALLHDAAEILTGDIPTPFKRGLPAVSWLEHEFLTTVVAPAFGLPVEIPPVVALVDRLVLAQEIDVLFDGNLAVAEDRQAASVRKFVCPPVRPWSREHAYNEFVRAGINLGLGGDTA